LPNRFEMGLLNAIKLSSCLARSIGGYHKIETY
jgi:hypothetical protein